MMSKTIWLVSPYGPIEGENWREYRFNQFGKYLSNNGFSVIWWTSSFSHHFKKYRSDGWKDIKVNENYIIRLVPTSSYKKNFGIGRVLKDFTFSHNFLKRAKKENVPDIILGDDNPLLLGYPSYKYSKDRNVPLIYDQMDIWPEFIVKVLNPPLNHIANIMFKPVYSKRAKIYGNLDGGISLGKHYLEFMLSVNSKLQNKPHALIYNGIDVAEFRSHLTEEIKETKLLKLNKNKGDIWCIFAGTLGPSYDIKGIVGCAEEFQKLGFKEFKFIIAGSGPYEEYVIEHEKKLNNLVYVGKLLPQDLIPIYGICDVGLATYSSGSNVDMCDKFYDYTAAGLAVINSLTGEISEHIRDSELGFNYEANNVDSLKKALSKFRNESTLKKAKFNSWLAGDRFDMNVQNAKLLDVIDDCLQKHNEE